MKDYSDMIRRIFESQRGKELLEEFGNTPENIEFYGRKRNEVEIKEDVIDGFFEEPLEIIVEVLPELWEEIKECVRDELEYDTLSGPRSFENCLDGNNLTHVNVYFDINEFLEDLIKNLKKHLRTSKEI